MCCFVGKWCWLLLRLWFRLTLTFPLLRPWPGGGLCCQPVSACARAGIFLLMLSRLWSVWGRLGPCQHSRIWLSSGPWSRLVSGYQREWQIALEKIEKQYNSITRDITCVSSPGARSMLQICDKICIPRVKPGAMWGSEKFYWAFNFWWLFSVSNEKVASWHYDQRGVRVTAGCDIGGDESAVFRWGAKAALVRTQHHCDTGPGDKTEVST